MEFYMNNNMHILNPFEEFITRCGVVLFVRASSSSPKCELDWPNARWSWLKDGWSLARAVVRAPTPKGPQARAKRRRDQRMVSQQLRRAVVNFINEINEAEGQKMKWECGVCTKAYYSQRGSFEPDYCSRSSPGR